MNFLDKLDHPVVFIFFAMLALAGLTSMVSFALKSAGVQGAATALGR